MGTLAATLGLAALLATGMAARADARASASPAPRSVGNPGRPVAPVGSALPPVQTMPRSNAPLDLFPAAAPGQANILPGQKTATTEWSSRITFVNRGGSTGTVRVESFSSGPKGNVTVTIKRIGTDGEPVEIGRNGLVPLDGTNFDLVAEASLATPGAYTVFIRVLDPKRTELTNASLTVTRESDMLPADWTITSPTLMRFFSGDADVARSLPVSGVDGRDLGFSITGAKVSRVGKDGESDSGLIAAPGTMNCVTQTTDQSGSYVVKEGDACTLALSVADVSAGEYRLRYNLTGNGGGVRAVEMPFKVRESVWLLVAMLIIGAVGGAIVSWWRDMQQPRVLEALTLARLDEDLKLKAARTGLDNGPELLSRLSATITDLRIRVADGESLDTLEAERNAVRAKLKVVEDAIYHWKANPANQAANTQLYQHTMRTIAAGSAEAAAAAVEALRAALDPAPAALGGAPPGGNVPLPDLPGLFTRADMRTLHRVVFTFEVVTSLILFAFFVLLTILVVWDADPAWGSTADKIIAVIIGAGAFGSMATTLGTFRSSIGQLRGGPG